MGSKVICDKVERGSYKGHDGVRLYFKGEEDSSYFDFFIRDKADGRDKGIQNLRNVKVGQKEDKYAMITAKQVSDGVMEGTS